MEGLAPVFHDAFHDAFDGRFQVAVVPSVEGVGSAQTTRNRASPEQYLRQHTPLREDRG